MSRAVTNLKGQIRSWCLNKSLHSLGTCKTGSHLPKESISITSGRKDIRPPGVVFQCPCRSPGSQYKFTLASSPPGCSLCPIFLTVLSLLLLLLCSSLSLITSSTILSCSPRPGHIQSAGHALSTSFFLISTIQASTISWDGHVGSYFTAPPQI